MAFKPPTAKKLDLLRVNFPNQFESNELNAKCIEEVNRQLRKYMYQAVFQQKHPKFQRTKYIDI